MFGIFPFLFSASVFASWGMFVINKNPPYSPLFSQTTVYKSYGVQCPELQIHMIKSNHRTYFEDFASTRNPLHAVKRNALLTV